MVGRPDLVPLNMGELALDDIRPEAGLLQNRARQCPETVHSGALVVAEPVEGVKAGIFGNGLSLGLAETGRVNRSGRSAASILRRRPGLEAIKGQCAATASPYTSCSTPTYPGCQWNLPDNNRQRKARNLLPDADF